MRTALLPPILCLSAFCLHANFFAVTLSPGPETADIHFCHGESTVFSIDFSISDDFADGVVISWTWTLTPVSDEKNIKSPELSTSQPGDQISGTLPDGGLLIDQLLLDVSMADAGAFLLTLSVSTSGGSPDEQALYEYPVYIDAVGSNDFRIDASALDQNGKAVLCNGISVDLFPNITEKIQFEPYTYNWSGPGDFSSSNASVSVATTGQYRLTVTNACGESNDIIQVEAGGVTPDLDAVIINWPIDNLFLGCPPPAGILTLIAQGDLKDYDYKWQVRRPEDPDYPVFHDFPDNSGNILQVGVDGILHQDGSEYRLLADNGGCLKAVEEEAGTPAVVTLKLLDIPNIDPLDPVSGMIGLGEMITFESSLNNAYGENTGIIWEIEEVEGGDGPIELGYPDGTDINAGSLITVSGEEDIPGANATVTWQVVVDPAVGEDKVGTSLRITYESGDVVSLPLQIRLRVVNKDDNQLFITGIPRLECNETIAEATLILPIELLYFRAFPDDGNILLEWATANETGNDFFTLERSFDGIAFTPFAQVDGAGTVFEEKQYTFLDRETPGITPAAIRYYRLKQTDFDGRYSYSSVISLRLKDQESGFALLNTSANGPCLHLDYRTPEAGEVIATIYDLTGRLLVRRELSAAKGLNKGRIDLPGLPHGIHVLQLRRGSEQIIHRFLW